MDTASQASATRSSVLASAPARAVLRAEDYTRAKRFYTEQLGLQVEDSEGWAPGGTVKAGDGTSFTVYERKGMGAPANTVLSFDVDDVEATVRGLRDRGVRFEDYDMPEIGLKTVNGIAQQGAEKVAWFKDTEGNIFSVGCLCD